MARNNGRWGRLQRVLAQDSSNQIECNRSYVPTEPPGDTPRYGVGANIENHPQITDYVPRKFRSMATLILPALLILALAEYAAQLPATIASVSHSQVVGLADGVAQWTTAAALAVSAVYAHIIFLLKRHRLDDLKGRYRAWRTGMILAIALGLDAVTGLHTVVAQALGTLTGFHPMGDAAWWLVPTLAVGAIVGTRIILNAAECRSALIMFLVSGAVLAFAAMTSLDWLSFVSLESRGLIARALPALSAILALVACLLTARYVVLDVQGLVEHRADSPPTYSLELASDCRSATETDTPIEDVRSEETQWTDGSDADYEHSDDRPLSKTERKRLRKQNRRHAA